MKTIFTLFIVTLALYLDHCQIISPTYFYADTWIVNDTSAYDSTGLCLPFGTVSFAVEDSGMEMTASQWQGSDCSDLGFSAGSSAYLPFNTLPEYDENNSSSYCSGEFCYSLETAGETNFSMTIARGGWSATVYFWRYDDDGDGDSDTDTDNTTAANTTSSSGNSNSTEESSDNTESDSDDQAISTSSPNYFYGTWQLTYIDMITGQLCFPYGIVTISAFGSGMAMQASDWIGTLCNEMGLSSNSSLYLPLNSTSYLFGEVSSGSYNYYLTSKYLSNFSLSVSSLNYQYQWDLGFTRLSYTNNLNQIYGTNYFYGNWQVNNTLGQGPDTCLPYGNVTIYPSGSGMEMQPTEWLEDWCDQLNLSSNSALYVPYNNIITLIEDNFTNFNYGDVYFNLDQVTWESFGMYISGFQVWFYRVDNNTASQNTSASGAITNNQTTSSSSSNSTSVTGGNNAEDNTDSQSTSTSDNTESDSDDQDISTSSPTYFYDTWQVTITSSYINLCLPNGTVLIYPSGSGMEIQATEWIGAFCQELGLDFNSSWYLGYNTVASYNGTNSSSYCSREICFELQATESNSFSMNIINTEEESSYVVDFERSVNSNTTSQANQTTTTNNTSITHTSVVTLGSTSYDLSSMSSSMFNLTDILNGKLSFSFGQDIVSGCGNNTTPNTWAIYHDNLNNCYDIATQAPTYTLLNASNATQGVTLTFPVITLSNTTRSFQLIINLICDVQVTDPRYPSLTVSLFLNNNAGLEIFNVTGLSLYGCPSYVYMSNATTNSTDSDSSDASDFSDDGLVGGFVCGPIIIDSGYIFNICPFNETDSFSLSDILGGSLLFNLAARPLAQCSASASDSDGDSDSEMIWATYNDNAGNCYEVAPQNPIYSLYNVSNPGQGLQMTYPVAVSQSFYVRSFQLIVNLLCDYEDVEPESTRFSLETDLADMQVMTVTGKTIYGCLVDPDGIEI